MYHYIKGTVVLKGTNYLVIDNNGVGYRIFTSDSVLQRISVDKNEKIYTYLHIREDLMELYGFLTREELSTFEMLISVSGVGPKVGLSLLSTVPPSEFALAVVTNNVKAITRAPGVGPKVAQRIILELKDKLKNDQLIQEAVMYEEPAVDANEAVSALMVLGYSQGEAKKAVAAAGEGASTEETVRQALKQLMK
ncbi:MAG: Holliday junction branch migration protein RuvA [Clostridia bacterium]|nr:Holliday junction branch migration protein RuvA [Clostridia bacterium]